LQSGESMKIRAKKYAIWHSHEAMGILPDRRWGNQVVRRKCRSRIMTRQNHESK
jgi:hypothetical protein